MADEIKDNKSPDGLKKLIKENFLYGFSIREIAKFFKLSASVIEAKLREELRGKSSE